MVMVGPTKGEEKQSALWARLDSNHWSTGLLARLFACTAHSSACSTLLALLACSASLTPSLARSLRSLLRSWKSLLLDGHLFWVFQVSHIQRLAFRVCSLRGALRGVSHDFRSKCLRCVAAKKRHIFFSSCVFFQGEERKSFFSLAKIDKTSQNGKSWSKTNWLLFLMNVFVMYFFFEKI